MSFRRTGSGRASTLPLPRGASQGHTCVPDQWLVTMAARVLQVDPLEVGQVFRQLLKDNLLRTEDVGDHLCVYPDFLYRAEKGGGAPAAGAGTM